VGERKKRFRREGFILSVEGNLIGIPKKSVKRSEMGRKCRKGRESFSGGGETPKLAALGKNQSSRQKKKRLKEILKSKRRSANQE